MENERLLAYLTQLSAVTETVDNRMKEKAKTEDIKKMSGTDFEHVVYDALLHVGLKKEQINHSPQKFPDYVITDEKTGEKIGIEVKKTNENKWEVQGGSVFESHKNGIDDTYILMGKFGGSQPEVRLKRYEECLADLRVTHSPRFYIKLDIPEGEDYLTKKNAKDLFDLSGEDLIRKVRELLRSNQSTWWSEEETTPFNTLSAEEKNLYLNDGAALFPEVFGGDYSNFTPWMIYSCLVWCGSVRDIFTAGGTFFMEEEGMYISAIMKRTIDNIPKIIDRISKMTDEEIRKFWNIEPIEGKKRNEAWIDLVERKLRLSNDLIKNNKKLDKYRELEKEEIEKDIREKFISLLKRSML